MATIIASLILATLCSGSLAAFLFPGPMGENGDYVTGVPEWTQGSNQTLKWKTDLDYYSIILWQQDYSGKWATSGPQVYSEYPFKSSIALILHQRMETGLIVSARSETKRRS